MRARARSVLVLQSGLRSGPWACRSLARAEYRVLAAHQDSAGWLTGRTRHAARVLRYPSPRRDPAGFLGAVENICRREGIAAVLPLSETAVRLLVQGLPSPGGAILIGPDVDQYGRVCDKGTLARTAAEAGVATPSEVIVGADGPDGPWPQLPSIVKPQESATPSSGGVVYRTAVVVRSEWEREEAVRLSLEETGGAVVQEEIPGVRWLVEVVRGERGVAILPRLILRSYPPRTGPSSVSRVVAPPSGLIEATCRLLELIDYRGPASVGFLVQDGRFLVHDVNLRLPFSVGAAIAAGFDMPRLAVEEALGLGPELRVARATRKDYVWLGGECRALVDGLRRRETAAPVRRIAADLIAAACSPRRVLDPLTVHDPLLAVAWVAGAFKLARASVAGLRRRPAPSQAVSVETAN